MPSLPPEGIGQSAAVTAPENEGGVAEVVPGLWRITMPMPFALRWANAYLLQGDGEWCLVDAGLATPQAEAVMLQGLAMAGIKPEALSKILLTHAHPDHIGLAGKFQQVSGAPVLMLEAEGQRMLSIWSGSDVQATEAVSAYYIRHGMPAEESSLERASLTATRQMVTMPQEITPLADGQEVRLAGASYQVIWTPGHADGHICLLRQSDGIFLVADHVLPRISPNIGLYPNSRPNPLRDYLESLEKVRNLPVRLALPGHGLPFSELAARVDELIAHHRERLEETAHSVAEMQGRDGVSAYAVAGRLFAGRFNSMQNRRFALGETLAHLEYLRFAGRLIQREDENERLLYEIAA